VNNLLYSLFSQIDCYVNDKCVTSSSQTQAYTSYIESQLGMTKSARENSKAIGFYDQVTDSDEANQKLYEEVAGGKPIELCGPIRIDFTSQEKLLVNGVRLRFNFQFNRPQFYLNVTDGYVVDVQILKAVLHIDQVNLFSNVLLAHQSALNKASAKYFYKRNECTSFTIPSGSSAFTVPEICNGLIPGRIILAMVSNTALNGSFKHDPFFFKHYGLSSLSFSCRGRQYPSQKFEIDFDSSIYLNSYKQLYKALGQNPDSPHIGITPKQFQNGAFFLAVNLKPDHADGCSEHLEVVERGPVRVEFTFKTALSEAISVLVFSQYDSLLMVDKDRQITTDFN
jgi:hypothetical protein